MMVEKGSGTSQPTCPKCGEPMDRRSDGVFVCYDCGWEGEE